MRPHSCYYAPTMERFYLTTSIMYTNAAPHVGFALELVQADAVARYRRLVGDEVFFLTGTDEHGTKIQRSAQSAGIDPQVFVDDIASHVQVLAQKLNISNTAFVRTTDRAHHWPAVEKLWRALAAKGDIYKKSYSGEYCVGHEAFLKPSELVDGLCPVHKTAPEPIEEENYFFRITAYKDQVRALIESDELRIVPATRKSEILNLLDDVEDVSFSRPSSQLSWGIPVPDDASQTMYVWADALTNYISALGYGTDESNMAFWPAQAHVIGKDILRFHAMIWPAMLLAAGLRVPKAIYVHGFITVNGEKMSKSLGNVIDPQELLREFSPDTVRFAMLREIASTEDGDFSSERIAHRYETDLANSLGNLVQRVSTLISSKEGGSVAYRADFGSSEPVLKAILTQESYHASFGEFRLHEALGWVWARVGDLNAYINDQAPWKQEGEDRAKTLAVSARGIHEVALLLSPIIPTASDAILGRLGVAGNARVLGGLSDVLYRTEAGEPLFPRVVKDKQI